MCVCVCGKRCNTSQRWTKQKKNQKWRKNHCRAEYRGHKVAAQDSSSRLSYQDIGCAVANGRNNAQEHCFIAMETIPATFPSQRACRMWFADAADAKRIIDPRVFLRLLPPPSLPLGAVLGMGMVSVCVSVCVAEWETAFQHISKLAIYSSSSSILEPSLTPLALFLFSFVHPTPRHLHRGPGGDPSSPIPLAPFRLPSRNRLARAPLCVPFLLPTFHPCRCPPKLWSPS